MTIPAGWYDDGSGSQRWWDGAQWTAHVVAGTQPAAEQQAAAPPSPAISAPEAETGIAPFTPPFVLPTSNAPAGISPFVTQASLAPDTVTMPSPPRRFSLLGLIGLIAATVGVVLSCIPPVRFIGWVVLGLAFTISLISLFFRHAKWPGITGISVSVIGAILAVAVSLVSLGIGSSPEADGAPSTPSPSDSGSSTQGEGSDRGEDPSDIEGAKMVPFDELAVGDCIPLVDYGDEDEIFEVPVVPCDRPHTDEVYFIYQTEEGEFPGDDALLERAWDRCLAEFEGFVGVSYEESELDIYSYQPTKTSWIRWDDRTVHCIVFSYDDVTGTLKDSRY